MHITGCAARWIFHRLLLISQKLPSRFFWKSTHNFIMIEYKQVQIFIYFRKQTTEIQIFEIFRKIQKMKLNIFINKGQL